MKQFVPVRSRLGVLDRDGRVSKRHIAVFFVYLTLLIKSRQMRLVKSADPERASRSRSPSICVGGWADCAGIVCMPDPFVKDEDGKRC